VPCLALPQFVEYKAIKLHSRKVTSVEFDPCDNDVLCYASHLTVVVHRVSTDEVLRKLTHHKGSVEALAFDPSGTHLATCGDDAFVFRYDSAIGRVGDEAAVAKLGRHTAAVNSVAWSRDGACLATASADTTALVYDAEHGYAVTRTLRAHTGSVLSVAFSPLDPALVVTCAGDRSVILWHNAGVRAKAAHSTDAVRGAYYAPDGLQIVTVSWDGDVRMLNPIDLTQDRVLKDHGSQGVHAAAYSSDGGVFATASSDKTVRVFHGNEHLHWHPAFEPQMVRFLQVLNRLPRCPVPGCDTQPTAT